MIFGKRNIVNTLLDAIKASAACALAIFYLIGSANVEVFHKIFHEHESPELHTAEIENDPCHVSVYHQERSEGCDHRTHLVKKSKCSLADSYAQNPQVLVRNTVSLARPVFHLDLGNSDHVLIEVLSTMSSGRAPPAI